jgi:ion channel-forming bestrophin family protein
MITYNPKDWFTFIFRIHKSETFRELIPLMIGVIIYSAGISYLELHTILSKEALELTKSISFIFTILGFTLSFLLVFRTNSAYERWWEGRKIWGELTNSSRAFASHMNGILSPYDVQERKTLVAFLSCYAYALQAHLKNEKIDDKYYQEVLNESFLKHHQIQIEQAKHQPLEIHKKLVAYVHQLYQNGKTGTQEIYHFKHELHKLIDACGACERIKNTPIPFSYSVFLKKFIFFYVMLFPIIYGIHMSYFIIPVTVFILYVFASIELIAEEIEDPFNGDPNDLPTFEMSLNIGNNVKSILSEVKSNG